VEDAYIWNNHKNGTYSPKSGYNWLLKTVDPDGLNLPSHSWSWIWKLQLPEKYKFFFWLACHNAVDTLCLLNHKNIAPSVICSRCGLEDETFLHCVRDCRFSLVIWHQMGFTNSEFFSITDAHTWLKVGAKGSQPISFSAGVWWSWRHRNLMCLGGETWSLHHLTCNIKNSIEVIKASFSSTSFVVTVDRYIKWNDNNASCVILNVDGSCHGIPVRTSFGGILRNYAGLFLSGFSGYIQDSDDIMLAELSAIYHGLIMAKNLGYAKLVCYSDSLVCINLINGPVENYHVYAVLIQDIKDLLLHSIVTVCHTLREGNQCADFLAKLGASSDDSLIIYESPPASLTNLLRSDVAGTLFLRE